MRLMRLIGWCIFLIVCQAEIITLTDKNRVETLSQSKHSLIYLFKPNCNYCKLFDPIYNDLSALYDNDEEFQIVKINAVENPILKQQFQLSSYPSIFLYDNEGKSLKSFSEARNLINLVNFINDNTDSINKDLPSNIFEIRKIEQFNERQEKGNLIVLTLSYLPDWQEYEFPTHFYQQLSYHHDIKFSILFIDLIDSTQFLNEFKISNYPSVIYFNSHQQFKLFKTFSKDHLSNNKLDESSLIEFIDNLYSQDVGYWFNDKHELLDFLQHEKYHYVNQDSYGFNVRQNDRIIDDSSYEEMVDSIGL